VFAHALFQEERAVVARLGLHEFPVLSVLHDNQCGPAQFRQVSQTFYGILFGVDREL
jgi:hypothetical protein